MEAERQTRMVLAVGCWGIVLALLVGGALYWLLHWRYIEYTDDAYVHGNQVVLTPLHPGIVTAIHTDDTFLVKKGELLIEFDKTDSEIALARAKEDLAQTVRDVCALYHQVFVYDAELNLKTAELIRDAQDYFHRTRVFRQSGVSLEDYEHAIARLRAQYSSLAMTEALYQKALAVVQQASIRNHPLVVAASEQVRDAWVRLYRCNLYAPVDGLVAQRTIQVGMWAPAGLALLTVIPLDQIWVNANYKETQLKSMRIGQRAKVTVDLWGGDLIFHGTIIGLPGGAGNAFSLLPPQNLSGNWIKIVQRLPVRVALDPEEIRQHPLRVGLSCKSTVDIRDKGGEMVPLTTRGPLYQTSVLAKEEWGDSSWIEEIITANLDPTLAKYADKPLKLKRAPISMESVLKEALQQDRHLQEEISSPEPYRSPLFDTLYGKYLR